MWVKIDDGFFRHPKVRAAGRDARDMQLAALQYCNENLTDGFVPDYEIVRLAAEASLDMNLIQAAVESLLNQRHFDNPMWRRVKDGYRIHDFHVYQPSAEEVKRDRARNAQRQRDFQDRKKAEHAHKAEQAEGQQAGLPFSQEAGLPFSQEAGLPFSQEAGLPFSQEVGLPFDPATTPPTSPSPNDVTEAAADNRVNNQITEGVVNTVSNGVTNAQEEPFFSSHNGVSNGGSRIPYPESRNPNPATTPPTSPSPHGVTIPPEAAISEVVVASLIENLKELGVSDLVAEELVSHRGAEFAARQIEYLPYRVKEREGTPKAVRDPAALLVKSIEDRYAPPASYSQERKAAADKEYHRQKQEEREQEQAAQRSAHAAGAARMQSAWCGLSEEERAALAEEVTVRFTKQHKEHAKKHAEKLRGDPLAMPFGIGKLWRDLRDGLLVERGLVEKRGLEEIGLVAVGVSQKQ